MKKFAFLALLLLLYYIAGMYGSPALMVLFLTQLFLMAVMFLLSFYLRRHLSVSFAEKMVSAEKDSVIGCRMPWSRGLWQPARFSGYVPALFRCFSVWSFKSCFGPCTRRGGAAAA